MENEETEDFGIKLCSKCAGQGTMNANQPRAAAIWRKSQPHHLQHKAFPRSFLYLFPPPPVQHPLLSSIPEEPVGAQHSTGAIAAIPSPLQSHSTTTPRRCAGEGCTESRQAPRGGRALRLQHPKQRKAPFMFSVRAELQVFFLPDTFNNTIHESADLAQESSHAPVTEASGQAHGTDFAYHDRR